MRLPLGGSHRDCNPEECALAANVRTYAKHAHATEPDGTRCRECGKALQPSRRIPADGDGEPLYTDDRGPVYEVDCPDNLYLRESIFGPLLNQWDRHGTQYLLEKHDAARLTKERQGQQLRDEYEARIRRIVQERNAWIVLLVIVLAGFVLAALSGWRYHGY